MMLYKRLEQGRFKFPRQRNDTQDISHAQLYGLLAGFDFIRMADYPELDFSHYFSTTRSLAAELLKKCFRL